jgi:hypothetical protein
MNRQKLSTMEKSTSEQTSDRLKTACIGNEHIKSIMCHLTSAVPDETGKCSLRPMFGEMEPEGTERGYSQLYKKAEIVGRLTGIDGQKKSLF